MDCSSISGYRQLSFCTVRGLYGELVPRSTVAREFQQATTTVEVELPFGALLYLKLLSQLYKTLDHVKIVRLANEAPAQQ